MMGVMRCFRDLPGWWLQNRYKNCRFWTNYPRQQLLAWLSASKTGPKIAVLRLISDFRRVYLSPGVVMCCFRDHSMSQEKISKIFKKCYLLPQQTLLININYHRISVRTFLCDIKIFHSVLRAIAAPPNLPPQV